MGLSLRKTETPEEVLAKCAETLEAHRAERVKASARSEREIERANVTLANCRLARQALFEAGDTDAAIDAADIKVRHAENAVQRATLASKSQAKAHAERDAELVAELTAAAHRATLAKAEAAAAAHEAAKDAAADYMNVRAIFHKFGLMAAFSVHESPPPFVLDASSISSGRDLKFHPALDRWRHSLGQIRRALDEGRPL